MKILIVNTYHYLRGGDCRHVFGLGDLLATSGHQVHYFAMKGKKNLQCVDSGFFVKEIDYRQVIRSKKLGTALKVLTHSTYSVEARKKIGRFVDEIEPDIAHIHSIRHHITKSILPELGKREIPIVWTLHDFKELCPNTSFYDGRTICEMCKGGRYINIIRKRCKKGSLSASIVTFLEAVVNGRERYERLVDQYIAPSRFLRNKFLEFGYSPEKILHLPNFIEIDRFVPLFSQDGYLLFLGRLENGKGLRTLIEGFSLAKTGIGSSLIIAGTGSMEDSLRAFARRLGASNVEFVGFRSGQELMDLTRNAKAILIPSELYENYPFSGLEAMAYGKPIIGSRIGGIPEQVQDGVTGFLFEPFNPVDLAAKINILNSLPQEKIKKMGRKGREKIEKENSSAIYLKRITEIYERVIENKRRRSA